MHIVLGVIDESKEISTSCTVLLWRSMSLIKVTNNVGHNTTKAKCEKFNLEYISIPNKYATEQETRTGAETPNF